MLGQRHLRGQGTPLDAILRSGRPQSTILRVPTAVGKTTTTRQIAACVDGAFTALRMPSDSSDLRTAIRRAV